MRLILLALAATCSVTTADAGGLYCQADALTRAGHLLKLHWDSDGAALADLPGAPSDDGEKMAWSLDVQAVELPPVPALAGSGLFNVLEVNGYVYKATYRMHFLYAQIPDACVLMGQEIIEVADPY